MSVLETSLPSLGWILLCLPVLVLLYFWEWHHPRTYWKLRAIQRIPSPLTRIPLLGDTIYLATKTPKGTVLHLGAQRSRHLHISELLFNFTQWQSQKLLKRSVKGAALGIPFVFLFHPDDIEAILGSTVNIKKGREYKFFKPWLGEGLLLSEGAKWRQRRKLLTPTFHFRILEDNVGQVFSHSEKFVEKLLEKGSTSVAVEKLVKNCTLDVICDTAMGIKMDCQENKAVEYVKALEDAFDVVVTKTLKVWLEKDWISNLTNINNKYKKALKTLHNFTQNVIRERKEMRKRNSGESEVKEKRKALLDLLLDLEELNPGTFTFTDIQEEVDTFTFEGHDTVAAAITFALYSLAQNPHIQERILEEQEHIFGSENRKISLQDLQEMTYLEMVIKEVLRLYPSVPFFTRRLQKDTTLGDGNVIGAGTNVCMSPLVTHRNAEFWDDPDEFRPERFLPGTERHPYSYFPFSAGPRNCIGMKFAMNEMKTTLSTVIRNCHLEPVTKTLDLNPNVILKNDFPIEIRVIPRKSKML